MKILPLESVQYLRPYACSHRSDCSTCPSHGKDCHFPNPYNATNKELESVPYICEVYAKDGNQNETDDTHAVVLTFDEIVEDYNEMKNDPLVPEGIRECMDEEWPDVYAYLRDCIDNGLHPCTIIE